MPKAKRLASGNYRALAYDRTVDGARKYKSFTAPTRKEAEFQAAEFEYKKKKERLLKNNFGALTFKEAADRYIENKENVISPSTVRGYKSMLKADYPLMLSVKIDKLAADDTIQKQMNENAKKHSAKSLRNQFGFISAVMRFCGYYFGKDNVTLKPPEHHPILVPTKADMEKIISVLGQDPEIQCPVLLALTCSLRMSEIVDLEVDDVDGNDVLVHGATVRGERGLIHKETNKSKAGYRRDTMPPELARLMEKRCEQVGQGRLFTLHPSTILERFQRLLVKNGLPKYTIQSLRHCFAATMHALNVPDKYIMEMGGWSTNSVMKNIYQYTFEDETRNIKQKANAYYSKMLKPARDHKNARPVGKHATRNRIVQHEMQHDLKKIQ
ncbi:MAG: site-specific integrase [Oscillospiraceae bacterium]|jgi:integrase|nr:site-specific integrase [Oscillospiraceae bacterium]